MCGVCHNEALVEEEALQHHEALHYELEMYPCVICAAKLWSRKGLDKHHQVEHVGKTEFLCSMCRNAF